jgi:hypothetical protein
MGRKVKGCHGIIQDPSRAQGLLLLLVLVVPLIEWE